MKFEKYQNYFKDYLITKNKYNYTLEYTDTISSNLQGIKGRNGWEYTIYVYNLKK